MKEILTKIEHYIKEHQLCEPGQRLLAAVSGGIDSSVLCEVLHKLEYDFAIAHCNFGLRGEESNEDEQFVRKLAKKYKVPVHVEHFDTQTFAEQEQLSIQMAARVLRYHWFARLRKQHQYDRVVTAHHQNDTTETMLLNLVRGTGLAGLHGIPPKNGHVIRPLLCLDKEAIFDIVAERRLVWREDSSNESTKYHRNKIRQEVVPVLKELNPNLETTMLHTAERIAGAEQIFHAYVNEMREKALRQEPEADFLDMEPLREAAALPVVLQELLRPYHFTYPTVKEIVSVFEAISGKTFESPTHVLVKDREQLVITPKNLSNFGSLEIEEGQQEVETEQFKLAFTVKDAADYHIPLNKNVASLDLDQLEFPLRLRRWQQGDWFVPIGMNGKKKISDFLVDNKVPLNLKQQVMVLQSGPSIAWIVGHRPDNRFKITDKTERVLELRLEKK